jgi:hypothetical protein
MTGVPPQVWVLAGISGTALGSAALAVLALRRAQPSNRREPPPQVDAAIGVLQQKIEDLQQQLEAVRRREAPSAVPHAARAALNLDKRSQALRMHRRGDDAAQIAASLEIPLQEVNLLLKVHRIVLRSI